MVIGDLVFIVSEVVLIRLPYILFTLQNEVSTIIENDLFSNQRKPRMMSVTKRFTLAIEADVIYNCNDLVSQSECSVLTFMRNRALSIHNFMRQH